MLEPSDRDWLWDALKTLPQLHLLQVNLTNQQKFENARDERRLTDEFLPIIINQLTNRPSSPVGADIPRSLRIDPRMDLNLQMALMRFVGVNAFEELCLSVTRIPIVANLRAKYLAVGETGKVTGPANIAIATLNYVHSTGFVTMRCFCRRTRTTNCCVSKSVMDRTTGNHLSG